jgi:hypothetical protein
MADLLAIGLLCSYLYHIYIIFIITTAVCATVSFVRHMHRPRSFCSGDGETPGEGTDGVQSGRIGVPDASTIQIH